MQCALNVMVFGTLFLEILSVGGNNKICLIFKLVVSMNLDVRIGILVSNCKILIFKK